MKPEIVICTNIYNRTQTLPSYFDSFCKATSKPCHLMFNVNYDELWPEEEARNAVSLAFDAYDEDHLKNYGHTISINYIPNTGLMGYNLGITLAKIYDVPVLLCNDDVVFGEGWCDALTKLPEEVLMDGFLVKVDPKSIGAVGPVYVHPGSMRHQEFNPSMQGTPYRLVDFVVGHATLLTVNAVRAGVDFDPKHCQIYGPMDVFLSQNLILHELNTLVCYDTCFDFYDSKESAFHNGDSNKFREKLTPLWNKMADHLKNEFQPLNNKKWGYNRWSFSTHN